MIQESVLLIILLILFTIAVFAIILWQGARNKLLYLHGKFNPYKKKSRFLTQVEQELFNSLNSLQILQSYHIFPQLHLSTLLQVKPDAKDLMGKFEYINKLFVDFVIFDKNLNPVVVIELNDRTHLWNSRKSRDEFVAQTLQSSGIPLLTLVPRDAYFKDDLEQKILPYVDQI